MYLSTWPNPEAFNAFCGGFDSNSFIFAITSLCFCKVVGPATNENSEGSSNGERCVLLEMPSAAMLKLIACSLVS